MTEDRSLPRLFEIALDCALINRDITVDERDTMNEYLWNSARTIADFETRLGLDDDGVLLPEFDVERMPRESSAGELAKNIVRSLFPASAEG